MKVFYKIPGYKDQYVMSADCTVKRKARTITYKTGYEKKVGETKLKSRPNNNGILMVDLYDGKKKLTRSLVSLRRTVVELKDY